MKYDFAYGDKQVENAKLMISRFNDPHHYGSLCQYIKCYQCPLQRGCDNAFSTPCTSYNQHKVHMLYTFLNTLTNIYEETD
jgi:hypothetical protein